MATVLDFAEAVFPTAISYGSQGGPEFSTSVAVLASGHEQRIVNWEIARARYNVSFGVRTPAQLSELIRFFRAMRGKATGFWYFDHADHTVSGGELVTIAGLPHKRYSVGGATYDRRLYRLEGSTFWVPVRFDVDYLPTSFEQFEIGAAPEITLVEIRL